jgi:hypothetical protein
VPLFVLDPAVLGTGYGRSADRRRFLAQSLSDLDASLEELGSSLVVRRHVPELATLGRPRVGTPVLTTNRVGEGSGLCRATEQRIVASPVRPPCPGRCPSLPWLTDQSINTGS